MPSDPRLYRAMAADLAAKLGQVADAGSGLLDFVPRLTPGFRSPHHLAPLAAKLEEAVTRGNVRICAHAPPRHGKTELVLGTIPWAFRRRPKMEIMYATYGQSLSESKSARAQELCRAAGFAITKDAVSEWRIAEGGVVRATSIGGPGTGEGADLLIVDDFFKNRAEAESSARRKFVWDWISEVGLQRLAPNGSAIVNAARWHVDDPTGRLVKMGWPYLRFPAIEESGLSAYDDACKALAGCDEPFAAAGLRRLVAELKAALRVLWPEQWPVDKMLERRRMGESSWASLQQGTPRPRGGTIFHDAYHYQELPTRAYRDAMGVDLAYTVKTANDASALVHMRRVEDLLYVVNALKVHAEAPEFMARVGAMQMAAGGPPCAWYTSTTERGTAQLGAGFGARIIPMQAKEDKYSRWQPYAASWNGGRVLVPADSPPWLDTFLDSHLNATGIGDEDDDEVDAGSSAHDLLAPGSVFASLAREDAPVPVARRFSAGGRGAPGGFGGGGRSYNRR